MSQQACFLKHAWVDDMIQTKSYITRSTHHTVKLMKMPSNYFTKGEKACAAKGLSHKKGTQSVKAQDKIQHNY